MHGGIQLKTSNRYHRARHALHRSYRRRSNDSEIKYRVSKSLRDREYGLMKNTESTSEWHQYYNDTTDGPRCSKAWLDGAGATHGLLQPASQLWRGEDAYGRKRGRCQWFHYRRLATRGGCQIPQLLYQGWVSCLCTICSPQAHGR
jgi:hypothetical protein